MKPERHLAKSISKIPRYRHLRDLVLPFVFTALSGAFLGFAFDHAIWANRSWYEVLWAGMTGWRDSRVWLLWATLASAVAWVWVSRTKRRLDLMAGTLYVWSALHESASPRDYASSTVGEAFKRVKPLRRLTLPNMPRNTLDSPCALGSQMRQAAEDLVYSLGDDETQSNDHLVVNGVWYFGMGLGVQLCANEQARLRRNQAPRIRSLYQWHAPNARGVESERIDEKLPAVGGERVWATDVLDIPHFASKTTALALQNRDSVDLREGTRAPLSSIPQSKEERYDTAAHVRWDFLGDRGTAILAIRTGPQSIMGPNWSLDAALDEVEGELAILRTSCPGTVLQIRTLGSSLLP